MLNHSVELQPVAATLAFEENFSQHEAQPESPVPKQECAGQLADTVNCRLSNKNIFATGEPVVLLKGEEEMIDSAY